MRRLSLVLSAVVTFSCGGAPAPTLSGIQSKIFTPKCATAGCHAGAGPAQELSLEGSTHAKLVGVSSKLVITKKLVVAGDAAQSFLFEKVSSASPTAGTRMPASPPLSASEIEEIRAWIAAGAPND